jgi:Arc/MetJ-type ribon-helix-helix transcriptional regulator
LPVCGRCVVKNALGYNGGMKVKTSITLSEELLEEIDKQTPAYKNRSVFLEAAARSLLVRLEKAERDAAELERLNRNAAELNREAGDVLEYQVES